MLMRVEAIPSGSKIWAEDEEKVWVLTEVVRQDNTILTVRERKTGEHKEIDLVSDNKTFYLAADFRSVGMGAGSGGHYFYDIVPIYICQPKRVVHNDQRGCVLACCIIWSM